MSDLVIVTAHHVDTQLLEKVVFFLRQPIGIIHNYHARWKQSTKS